MKTLYLDLFSGISGDMFVAALLDLGAGFTDLEQGLAGLGVKGYHLHATRGQKSGITGTKFDVHLENDHHHAPPHIPHHHHGDEPHRHHHGDNRDFAQICALIQAAPLSDWVKAKATAVFRRIAEAEGTIHGQPPEQVHFHEVGAVDSIMDIVGGCLALELLGKPRVLASAVVEGVGWVKCAHGRFPVPTPATLEILAARGVALSQCAEPHELVTPTGAALLAEFAESFGPLSELRIERVGYGLGTRDNHTRPNVLRALIGESAVSPPPASHSPATHDWETDTVAVLETNLDDLNPEILGHFAEIALAAGALDVFYTPVQMKKGRPATLLSVLCDGADADRFSAMILTETSAFGVRRIPAERRKLRREFKTVATPFGEVTVKLGSLDGRVVQSAPEFESCRKLAEQAGVPVKAVYEAAARAAGA